MSSLLPLLAASALLLAACTPSTSSAPGPAPSPPDVVAPPLPDAGAGPDAVCAHLAALGCSEGRAPACAATLQQIAVTRVTDPKLACLLGASSAAAAQACGTVGCTP